MKKFGVLNMQLRPDTKHYIAPFCALLGFLAIGSLLYYYTAYPTHLKLLTDPELQSINHVKTEVDNELTHLLEDLKNLHEHKGFEDAVLGGAVVDLADLTSSFNSFIRHKKSYDQVRILDISGMEVLRINKGQDGPIVVEEGQLRDKSGRYYFRDSILLSPGEIYLSPFDLNVEKGQVEKPFKPMLRVSSPLYDHNQQLRGVLVLNYLGKSLLSHMDKSSQAGSSVELLNDQGYWLRSKDVQKEWSFMFPGNKQFTFADEYPSEWKSILSRETGQLQTKNGVFTYAKISPFNGHLATDKLAQGNCFWLLVSHLKGSDLQVVSANLIQQLLRMNILMLLLLSPACFYYARVRQKTTKQIVLQTANAELKQALAEIKTLRGTLPICFKCKSVRDDSGYWDLIENYLQEHTEAELSHGLCPECMEAMYAGKVWYEKYKSKNE